MKITLRKRDSVTSTVLFIFNILGEYKSEYSIKLAHLLEFMQHFNKSEVSTRTGLSRMVKANILVNKKENNETVYELTEVGLQNVRSWNKGIARFFRRYELRWKGWDQQWRFLTIIDFNKSKYENQYILEELWECGLQEINNNIWITPYDIDNDIITLLDHQKLNYLKFSGTCESNMNLYNLLNDTFQLSKTKKKYLEFINKIKKNRKKINKVNGGSLLPILFETGWDFYDVVTGDPALPKELLKVWEGDKAISEMKIIRSQLYNKIIDYFKEKNV